MKILWLTNIPSPYRVNFFNELGKQCELTVLFEKGASDERDESWKNFNTDNFKAIFLKGKRVGVAEAFCPSVVKYIDKSYDHIVVTDFSASTGMLAILKMRLEKIPYEVESDGAFAGSGKGIKEVIKKLILKKAVRYFSTAAEHDKYYLMYGANSEKIVRYPFTSVLMQDIISCPLSNESKAEIRSKLGIKEERVILSVGQFIHRKGFDILLHAVKKFDGNSGIYIVGGDPTEEYLQMKKTLGLENVHFVGFKTKDKLAEYYLAADIFVLPTREDIWGLVINEAMAYGLPVITTNRCIAGLELVRQGENGYIVPVEDVEETAEKLNVVLNNDSLCKAMSEKSLEIISEYTIEKMAEKHIQTWSQ